MKFQFEFDKVKNNKNIQERIAKKFSALEKYLTNVKEDFHKGVVRIIKGDRFGFKVKVEVDLPGKNVVAEGKSESLLDAADEAYHKLARMIRKYLDKLKEKKH